MEEKRGDDAFPDTESGAKQEGDRESSACEANGKLVMVPEMVEQKQKWCNKCWDSKW